MSKTFKSWSKLTSFEIASIVGKRAEQIQNGEPALVPCAQDATPTSIAYDELIAGKLNYFAVQRKLPNNQVERISLSALAVHQ